MEEGETSEPAEGAEDVAADPLRALFSKPCTCRKGKAPCLASINVEKGMDHILSMKELNKTEKEM